MSKILRKAIERARTFFKLKKIDSFKKTGLKTGYPEPPKEIPVPKNL